MYKDIAFNSLKYINFGNFLKFLVLDKLIELYNEYTPNKAIKKI